jgi:hypothetical protein
MTMGFFVNGSIVNAESAMGLNMFMLPRFLVDFVSEPDYPYLTGLTGIELPWLKLPAL